MNFEKANRWLKQNYPQLEKYEIRAYTDELFFTATEPEGEYPAFRPAPQGFIYAIARVNTFGDAWGGDIVLLMPEDL